MQGQIRPLGRPAVFCFSASTVDVAANLTQHKDNSEERSNRGTCDVKFTLPDWPATGRKQRIQTHSTRAKEET